MFVLERPRIPKYSRALLKNEASATASAHSSAAPPSTASTRLSTTSHGRPYATAERRPSMASNASDRPGTSSSTTNISVRKVVKGNVVNKSHGRQAQSGPTKASSNNTDRQSSADSGFGEGGKANEDVDFLLPPRITAYNESECYLMSLPRCEQFINHLVRNLRPMMSSLRFTSEQAKTQMIDFARRLHRLSQELFIAFPRSASLISNSPRFQEFLRLAIENIVMRFVHDRIFPVICYLNESDDKTLRSCMRNLRESSFSADQLGLPEDFCVPLFAAVVELTSLDMRTTPLDRMTCLYDTVELVNVHIRKAVMETRDERPTTSESVNPLISDDDMVLLLATVIVQARPRHLLSTLKYADLFAWTVPIDMIEKVTLMSSATDIVKNIQPRKLLPPSGKLKREASMEEIIQLTEEMQQSYDRHGNRLEPFRSALDVHREKFAIRLEQSSADRTRRQEEAWARLDRCPTPSTQLDNMSRVKRGVLASIHTKLLCSSEPIEAIDRSSSATKSLK